MRAMFTIFLSLGISWTALAASIQKEAGPIYRAIEPSKKIDLPQLLNFNPTSIALPNLPSISAPSIQIAPLTPLAINNKILNSKTPPVFNETFTPSPSIATNPLPEVSEKIITELTPLQYRHLQAELFIEQERHELALGLYLDLLPETPKKDQPHIIFKLSELALKLDLYSDFKKWSMDLLPNPEYREKAFYNLVTHIRNYDDDLVQDLSKPIATYKLVIPPEALLYRVLSAQILTRQGNLAQGYELISNPDKKSALYDKASILGAVLLYRQGRVDEALAQMDTFLKERLSNLSFEIKNEALLLSARLNFQKGQYPQARRLYSQMDQNYIEWLPAMTEMGWAQILQGDYEGASGNMFSLHTDFFKNHFIPDSYLARTVGYLGLCQYGDALKTVIDLKSRYQPLVEKTNNLKDTWSPDQYYELIHAALKDPRANEINGVPRPWVSWLTRDVDFIREQKIINSLEDEINSYNRFTLKIIESEKQGVAEKQNLLSQKSLSDKQKDQLHWLNIQLHIFKKSRDHMRQLRSAGLQRIDKSKSIHRQLAGLALKQRMVTTHQSLLVAFEQVDLLQYEIFAGAGDQLRSIISGLPIDPRSFASERSSNDPVQVKWNFKGEVWKDEIGYFRSSLKNVCPSQPSQAAELSPNGTTQ